ncbi:hypothetical protein IE53DRAFT_408381 [Violaceomyces palustris]|uniref:Uncharacterized protein n=1 Tax=Violaceomyces palustris TaxID=1673888 RepID=A0ACD0P7E7_9BASI|nr:hypothetical protein IE53DRAFT_408381 [Violaceomyces palustris]
MAKYSGLILLLATAGVLTVEAKRYPTKVPDVKIYSDQHCHDNGFSISPNAEYCVTVAGSSVHVGNIKYAVRGYTDDHCNNPISIQTTGADTCFHANYDQFNTGFRSLVFYRNGPY